MRLAILALCSALFVSTYAAPNVLAAPKCKNDACQRDLSGIAAKAKKDCSSYMRKTMFPAPKTETVYRTKTKTAKTKIETLTVSTRTARETITSTSTTTNTVRTITQTLEKRDLVGGLQRRQQTTSATSIPRYASNCANASQYSSACSCLGASATTVTAPIPVITKTSKTVTTITPLKTTSITVTTIAATDKQVTSTTITRTIHKPSVVTQCTGPQPTFLLQQTKDPGPYFGYYAAVFQHDTQPDGTVNYYAQLQQDGTYFSFDGDGHLLVADAHGHPSGLIANNNGTPDQTVYFTNPANAADSLLQCSLSGTQFGSGDLSCSNGGDSNILQYCGSSNIDPVTGVYLDGVTIARTLRSSCAAITLTAVPLCVAPPSGGS